MSYTDFLNSKTTVTFEFPTRGLADIFVAWFDNIGEQNYWQEEECGREVVDVFEYNYVNLIIKGKILED